MSNTSASIQKPELIKAIQTAARTGQIVYGAKKVIKMTLHGKAKLIVLSVNAPLGVKRDLLYYAKLGNIPVLVFDGTNIELGNIIGRPHSVSALAIIDPGQSRILDLLVSSQ